MCKQRGPARFVISRLTQDVACLRRGDKDICVDLKQEVHSYELSRRCTDRIDETLVVVVLPLLNGVPRVADGQQARPGSARTLFAPDQPITQARMIFLGVVSKVAALRPPALAPSASTAEQKAVTPSARGWGRAGANRRPGSAS